MGMPPIVAAGMPEFVFPYLSSDAAILACWGALAAIVAVIATLAERRRMRRSNMDAVGCMPWTAIFLLAFLAAVVLLGLAARDWFAAP